MEWLWALVGAAGSALVGWLIVKFSKPTEEFIIGKLDKWMEKMFGDKVSSDVQLKVAAYLRSTADSLEKAAEIDSFQGE